MVAVPALLAVATGWAWLWGVVVVVGLLVALTLLLGFNGVEVEHWHLHEDGSRHVDHRFSAGGYRTARKGQADPNGEAPWDRL